MASGGKERLAWLNSLALWRLLMTMALLACAGLAGMLWLSRDKESDNAVASGRRLVVAMDTGAISGKQIALADLVKKPEAPPAQPPEPAPPPPENPPPAEPPAAAPPAEPAAPPVPPAPESAPQQQTPPVEPPAATPPEAAVPPPAEQPVAPAEQPVAPQPAPAPTAPPAEAPAVPVTPEPLSYDNLPSQPVPQQPQEQSAKPAVLPEAAPLPPLQGLTVPAVAPIAEKLPGVNATLTESSAEGDIPIIAADGTRAWRYYAKPHAQKEKKPMIALIITGLGQNKNVSEHAMHINNSITLSFSPYARDITQWGASARLTGHEVLLELPMEPVNYPASDPGPYGLLLEKGPQENETRIRWLMARIPTSIGFVTPVNERFSANTESFKLLMQSLANRGLMLVISREPSRDETKEVLTTTTTPNVVADILIDEELSETAIQARLTAIEQLATKRGYAVGIAQSYPLTIAQLKSWIESLAQKGFVLVPVSTIARLDYS